MRRAARDSGFTLIEVLIALTIVALGLSAAVRAATQVTSGALEMKTRTLALWVAENRLAEYRARTRWPAPGSYQGSSTQANVALVWRDAVTPTSDPTLRRIDIAVSAAAEPDYVLARLTGVAAMPAPDR